MDILAISYKNIWPFQNKLITVNFKKWNFLVKSPIWVWKSFLFFDWPLFGLYKRAERKVLNSKSNSGFIKILFIESGIYYLVIRDISLTKTWNESVKSSLFTTDKDLSFLQKDLSEIIIQNLDIQKLISSKIKLEEINFKSQNELQKTLEDVLSQREVFLNTNFLMQESDNIFETTPQERVNVLKNIFGLLWIDSAKDKVSEERKDLQSKLRMKKDVSPYNQKLKNYIKNLNDLWKSLEKFSNKSIISQLQNNLSSQMQDFHFLWEKINIEDFQIDSIDFWNFDKINKDIESQKFAYQNLKWEVETKQKYLKDYQKSIPALESQKQTKQTEKEKLENFIKSLDQKTYQDLKDKRQEKWDEQKDILAQIDFDRFDSYWWYKTNDIYEVKSFLDNLINEWKSYRKEKENIVLKKQNLEKEKNDLYQKLSDFDFEKDSKVSRDLEKEIQNFEDKLEADKSNISMNLENIKFQKKEYQDNLSSLDKKIKELKKNIEFQKEYYCDKISANCPYIKDINKNSLSMLEEQKNNLKKEKDVLLSKYNEKDFENEITKFNNSLQEISEKKKELRKNPERFFQSFFQEKKQEKQNLEKQFQKLDYDKEIKSLSAQEEKVEKKLKDLKDFFVDFDWQGFENLFKKYKDCEFTINQIHEKIIKFEKDMEKLKQRENKKYGLESEINSIVSQIEDNKKKIKQMEKDINDTNQRLKDYDIDSLIEIQEIVDALRNNFESISVLVQEYKDLQVEVKQLQKEEKLLSDLYNIFSKELMLVVLQEFLPSLENIINSFLSQIVDYEIRFKLEKNKQDKLEMEIEVEDEKGVRSVKSLSWWQRVVLRLVWVLSVCSMMRLKFLFLDETINNLDFSTVGKLAETIENFVYYQDIKFFVVTHSRQIKEMNIWNWVVEVEGV